MTYEVFISPNARRGVRYWRELWAARELLFFLAWRDILVRYKQAVLGVLWAVLRPVLTTIVFSLVFGKIAKLPAGDLPYPLLVLSGMIPWFFFANTVGESGGSLVNNSALITKVYFPRLVVPVSVVLVNFIDFMISSFLLAIMMLVSGIAPSFGILLLPGVVGVLVLLAVSTGLWMSALNAKFRDVQFVLPFMITFGLYLSPVGFSTTVVPEKWLWLFQLNPMVGVIDGFRWCLFSDAYPFNGYSLLYSFLFSVFMLTTGIAYFRSVEREIVDVL
ncbi:MAG: ABC transporter permease [Azonexus sp.]|nr:ABC transporter permease [Azonexus sp.]